MNVRFHGFRLKEGNVSLSDFVDSVIAQHGVEFPYYGDHRLVYMDSSDADYYIGLVLTAKDQRKFCELDSSGDYKITVRRLKDDHRLVDFNFFLICKATGAGLYQCYRGSCGLISFGHLLNHLYRAELGKRRTAALIAIGGDTAKEKQKKEVRGRFKMQLEFTPIFRKEDFDTIVSQMKKIKSLGFNAETLMIAEGVFVKNRKLVSSDRITFTFSQDGNLSRICKAISGIVRQNKYEDLSVSGEDEDGTIITVKLEDNLNSFDRCDFDLITEPRALDVENIAKSSIVDRMRQIIEKNEEYFS